MTPGACADPFVSRGTPSRFDGWGRRGVSARGVVARVWPGEAWRAGTRVPSVSRAECGVCAHGGRGLTTEAQRAQRENRDQGAGNGDQEGGRKSFGIGAHGEVRVCVCAHGGVGKWPNVKGPNGKFGMRGLRVEVGDSALEGPRDVATGGAERNPWRGSLAVALFPPRRGGGVSFRMIPLPLRGRRGWGVRIHGFHPWLHSGAPSGRHSEGNTRKSSTCPWHPRGVAGRQIRSSRSAGWWRKSRRFGRK